MESSLATPPGSRAGSPKPDISTNVNTAAGGAPNANGAAGGVANANAAAGGAPNANGAAISASNANAAVGGAPNANGAAGGVANVNTAAVGAPNANGAAGGVANVNTAAVGASNANTAAVGASNANGAVGGVANVNTAAVGAPNANGTTGSTARTRDDRKFDEYVSNIDPPDMMVSYFDRIRLARSITLSGNNLRCYDLLGIAPNVSLKGLLTTISIALRLLEYEESLIKEDDKQTFEVARTKLIHSINTALEAPHQLLANRVERISKFPKIRHSKCGYHHESHRNAHQLLVDLYHESKVDGSMRYSELEEVIIGINAGIQLMNDQIGLPTQYGVIPLQDMLQAWDGEDSDPDCELAEELVSDYLLPKGWGTVPPEDVFTEPDDVDKYWIPLQDALTPHILVLMREHGENGSKQTVEIEAARVNERLRQENKKRGLPACLHEVEIEGLMKSYDAVYQYFSAGDSENYETRRQIILHCCSVLGYPDAWIPNAIQNSTRNPAANPAPAQSNNPASVQGSDPVTGQNTNSASNRTPNLAANPARAQSNNPASVRGGNPVASQNANGGTGQHGKRQMAIIPKKVTRSILPGCTATGEKIICGKVSGTYARCVAETDNGGRKLLRSRDAGGIPVIQAAINSGGAQKFALIELKTLRPHIAKLGEYGFLSAAMEQWDPFSDKKPEIVMEFYHNYERIFWSGWVTVANLRGLFGSAVEPLVAESILPPDYSGPAVSTIEEALEILYGVPHIERELHWAREKARRAAASNESAARN